jgi:hypothetical protein
MEKTNGTAQHNIFIVRNNYIGSAERVATHRHKLETIARINCIIHEFHLVETSDDYIRLIDHLKLSEIEIKQIKELQKLDELEKVESIEIRSKVSLLIMAIYDIINDDQVLECCNYKLRRNRIQAIKILLNLRNKLKSGVIYNKDDIKCDLLWKVELCND